MLGITVFPEYIQNEGPEALLDNLLSRAPVTAVSTSPYVMAECSATDGGEREPPADGGKGLSRVLDRPLWGKREVWVKAAPSFEPELSLYQGLRYQPSNPTALTDSQGGQIDAFVEAAHERGLKVYLQIQAAIPPGYRVQFGGPEDDDLPRLPDGSIPQRRVDKNGSLASEHILQYGEALIADLLRRYPEIDGLRFDWPEYPPYTFDAIFLDFGTHAERYAKENGYDFESLRRGAAGLREELLERMDDARLGAFSQDPGSFASHWMDWASWLRLKSSLVANLLKRYRIAMDRAGGESKELTPSAFPHPWNILSGFNYAEAGSLVDAISCKYYTMHWPMMLRDYGDSLLQRNASLSEKVLADRLSRAFGVDLSGSSSLASFRYPSPLESHPVDTNELGRKQGHIQNMSNGTPIWPVAHSYGPTSDFVARAKAVFSVSKKRLWINRYAYLSDEKLDALQKELWESDLVDTPSGKKRL